MKTPRLSTRLLALPLALALVACGNGDEQGTQAVTDPVQTPGGTSGGTKDPGAPPTQTRDRKPRELPRVKPLTEEKAKSVLLAPLGKLQDAEDVHAALTYLAKLGDRSAIRSIQQQLLEKDEDGIYPLEESGAAMGLHVLKLYDEPGLEGQIIDVVKIAVEDEFVDTFAVAALSTLHGTSRQGDAESLLVRIVDLADGSTDIEAAALLVEWGTKGARSAFVQILDEATKAEASYVEDELIGAAVAGLIKMGDERGVKFMEGLIADPEGDFDPSAIVEGFAIKGATEVVPYVKRLVEAEVAEDAGGDSPYAAAIAFGVIFQDGGGGPHVPFLENVLHELDEPYAGVALWILGKDEQAPAVAEEIKRTLLNINMTDVSEACYLFERIADRKAAGDPAFRDLVDVGAQIEAMGANPAAQASAQARQRHINAAAAYAFLASKK